MVGDAQLFRSEYQAELEQWFKRRFGFLCLAYWIWGFSRLFIHCVQLAMHLFGQGPEGTTAGDHVAGLLAYGCGLIVTGHFMYARRPHLTDRAGVQRAASQMILALGAISLASVVFQNGDVGQAIFDLGFWHLSACLVLPWTPQESMRPMSPLIAVWGILLLLIDLHDEWVMPLLTLLAGPAVFLPGLAITAARLGHHSRKFRARMTVRHLMTMRREFSQARHIHDSLFPTPFSNEHIEFAYAYQPMREIGGDFIDVHRAAGGVIDLVLLDVTGHGLSAALTVNRLSGELERVRGESPDAGPAHMLEMLNRYVNVTMAPHNMFATGIAVRLDPRDGTLAWCSAGHPPAFLRRASGQVEELGAGTVVLGALPADHFTAPLLTSTLQPGDELIAYTDGLFEARDREGEHLGLAQLRELVRTSQPTDGWPGFLVQHVSQFQSGRMEDDILVATLSMKAFDTGNDLPTHLTLGNAA